jgi:Xaa-Pro aminopeptidase
MFDSSFFAANRRQLYNLLKPQSFLVITANMSLQHSADIAYDFEQDGHFWYLTGLEMPDWLLVFDRDTGEELLIMPRANSVRAAFDGSLTAEQAVTISGVKEVLDKKAGAALLKKLCQNKKRVYGIAPQPSIYFDTFTNPAQRRLHRRLHGPEFVDVRKDISTLRAIKQPQEIKAIQTAIDVTAQGLEEVYAQLPSLKYEYEAEALLSYAFRRRGFNHAFHPIVAAGKHSCTFHYESAQSPLGKGVLLFDIGAQAGHYAADIARVISLGSVTDRQQAIFDAVAHAQRDIIALLQPGQSVKTYLEEVEFIMLREMVQLGILPKTAIPHDIYTNMQHAISHGLGIDVHDPLGQPKTFKEGMVLTVEPGIYSIKDDTGVRIEDDILITATGPKVLSAAIPIGLK